MRFAKGDAWGRLRRTGLASCSLLAALACGESPGADAGATPDAAFADAESAPDAAAPDLGFPDAGHVGDAGFAAKESACLPCNTGCTGGLCVTAGREQFCADRCDADLESCLAAFTCLNIAPAGQAEVRVCAPPGGSCRRGPAGMGTPCFRDLSLCHPDRSACQGDEPGMGYCTDTCFAGCPNGYECGEGDDGDMVCLARFAAPAERCAKLGGPERGCTLDVDCPAELSRCVGARPGLAGVCAAACDRGGCPSGQRCRRDGVRNPACIPDPCDCRASALPLEAPAGTRDLLSEALAGAGLDRCSAIFSVSELAVVEGDVIWDPYRLAFFDPLRAEPLRIPEWADRVVAELEAAVSGSGAATAARMIERAALLLDRPAVRRPMDRLDASNPLGTAIIDLVTELGGVPDRAAIAADAADVPPDLALALAIVVDGVRRAALAQRAGFAALGANQLEQIYQYGPAFLLGRADGLGLAPAASGVETLLNRSIRYGELFGGAADLLDAIDMAALGRFTSPAGTSTATEPPRFVFNQRTPIGRIAIGGPENGAYDPAGPDQDGAWALLVDVGGHDDYRIPVAGNQGPSNPVSALVDLGGRDRYGYLEVPDPLDGARLPSDGAGRHVPNPPNDPRPPFSLSETPRQGGGRAGIAVLVDLGPDGDRYRSLRLSQGAGAFGVGVLVDEGGDDRYEGEAMVQGAALFGIGLHLDLGGDDERRAYQAAQGFAFARGVGLSYDRAGRDRYLMDVGDTASGGDPLYPAAQREQSNASFGQGFGFGRRADSTDRAFMSGGLGVLIDAAGDDVYEASIFAQGAGFWFGTGILADLGGGDRYDAIWYAMGAGAHHAIGALLEAGGDDAYGGRLPRENITLGAAHDLSATFFIDEAGNDSYHASRATVGAGNVNGFGVFVDNAGDDAYLPRSLYAIGAAALLERGTSEPGAARRRVDTVGLFIDAGGRDRYEWNMAPIEGVGDGTRWSRPQTTDDPRRRATERGSGVDAVGESTIHFRR